MSKSTSNLQALLRTLRAKARGLQLTDSRWAERAGLRKETLSRLRGRNSCDLDTLQALTAAVGAQIDVVEAPVAGVSADGRFPARFDRDYEAQLLKLCARRGLDPQSWRRLGPAFFMAGLAMILASLPEFDRSEYLALAEALHAGSSQVGVFSLWLQGSPLRPSRFVPMLLASLRHAA